MQKPGPHLAYISVFSIFWFKFFFAVFKSFPECFRVISGFSITVHIKFHYYFLTGFLYLISPLAQTLVTPLDISPEELHTFD